MAASITFKKGLGDVVDYEITWNWLDGDTISDLVVTAETGLIVDSSSFTNTTTTFWLSGGTAGTSYIVLLHITTAAGRQAFRRVKIKIKEK